MISISKINATTVVKGMGMIIWFMKKIKGNETNKNHTHRKQQISCGIIKVHIPKRNLLFAC